MNVTNAEVGSGRIYLCRCGVVDVYVGGSLLGCAILSCADVGVNCGCR